MDFGPFLEALRRWDPLIQVLVALGTLAVAIVAYLEIANSHRERRERQLMELGHRVYKPMRDQLRPAWRENDLRLYPGGLSWSTIERDAYPTSAFVPSHIRAEAEFIEKEAGRLGTISDDILRGLNDRLDQVAHPFKVASHHPGSMGIRVLVLFGDGSVGGADLDIVRCWLSGLATSEWAAFAAEHYGRKSATLALQVGNNRIGGHPEALQVLESAKQFLDGHQNTKELARDLTAFESRKENLLRAIEHEIEAAS